MEGMNDTTDRPEVSALGSDKTPDPASQNEERLESDDSVCVTQQGQVVHQDVADLLDDSETSEPQPDPTEEAEVAVRRKEVKVKTQSNVKPDVVEPVSSERVSSADPVLVAGCQSDQQPPGLTSENIPRPSASVEMRSLEMITFSMIEQRSRPVRGDGAEYSSMPMSMAHFDHILNHARKARESVGFLETKFKGQCLYYETKEDITELELLKKKLHLTKIVHLHNNWKSLLEETKTTLDSIRRSTTESESNHVSSTNNASFKDDTVMTGPSLEAAENQVSTTCQLQNEVKSGNDTEVSSAASSVETGSESFKPATALSPTPSTPLPSLQKEVHNKHPPVDRSTVVESPEAKVGHQFDPKNQEFEESLLLEAGARGGAGRDDTSTVPLNEGKASTDGEGREGYISHSLSDIVQDVTVNDANRRESDGTPATNSSHLLQWTNGLVLEAINEAISSKRHTPPRQREQLLFDADLPSQEATVPPEAESADHTGGNPCGDTNPWIRRKGFSKSASEKSYNELHFGQPPGSTEKRDKKPTDTQLSQEHKEAEATEVDEHLNDNHSSAEFCATASEAGTSEEDPELEGAVGGINHPTQQLCHHAEKDVIIDATKNPGSSDRPVCKVQGVQRVSLADELVSESQGEEYQHVLSTPDSGPPAIVHLQGEEYPRRTASDVPENVHLFRPPEEGLRVTVVRSVPAEMDRLREGWPHVHTGHQPSPSETVASRCTDTPGKESQAPDQANITRCYSCPLVCSVQPYKDQENSTPSSNESSSPQRDNSRVVETQQQQNQEPRITVLDNAQQLLAVIRTSPTPVEQIANSIQERVFQELVLTAFTLGYPGGDVIPQGTLLGEEAATVLVFPAESDQPGVWRVVNNNTVTVT